MNLKERSKRQPPCALRERGRIGQRKHDGSFFEEFLPELQGRKGAELFKQMAENDDIIGAILFAIEMLVRQARWDVEPSGGSKEEGEAAKFVKSCMHDMQTGWQDTISEILSFLVYGWSYHEIVYKRRMGKHPDPKFSSGYDDGLIGWRKLPIRSQDTLLRWEYDTDDELVGLSQTAAPDFKVRTIPIEKAIHFVTKSRKGNPEGRSILRNSYRSYYFKCRFQEIEGIGVERDLAGLPMLQPPEGTNIWDADDPMMANVLAVAENLVKNVRRDALEGIVLPYGWTFSLLKGEGKRQFEVGNIIERYDSRMAMTVLADFVLLGHQMHGSYALSSDKTELFAVAIGTYLDIICEAFNTQAIPRLMELNSAVFKDRNNRPRLVHGDIEKVNMAEMAAFLEKMSAIGLVSPDEGLKRFVRRLADLPESAKQP